MSKEIHTTEKERTMSKEIHGKYTEPDILKFKKEEVQKTI